VKAISDMQTFGMIVTAEPYFAVQQPGNVVVLENVIPADTLSKVENIDARYELLGAGFTRRRTRRLRTRFSGSTARRRSSCLSAECGENRTDCAGG